MKPDQKSAAPLPEGMRVKAPTVDLTGQIFGRLTALRVVGRRNRSLLWECVCRCGKGSVLRTSAALRKRPDAVASCGCYLKEISRERLQQISPWNKGKTYTNKHHEAVFRTRKSWAEAVRKARGDSCEQCGWDKAACDVHHAVPRGEGGLNTVANGRVLCPNCHRLAHVGGGAQ
jgi:hypothetical protein